MARILIVEDEPGIAMALEDELTHHGYDVELARDGQTAIDEGRDSRFDAIVLDVMLPRKDGFSVCRELRALGVRTPILMLTAKTEEQDTVRGLEIGADDYLTKPYRPHELRARIQALLRRASDMPTDTFRFGDVEVNFSRREVTRAGQVAPLTPLEFRLLETFIRHRGRALGRQRLIDEAWGHDTFVTGRVVDNQVTNLRKKVEVNPAAPTFILSVRGFGYRFDG
jgi:two-component system, OmpR family, alkaline phosphatase synthesis response regulator PhoP